MTRHKTLREKIAAMVMAAGLLFAAAPAGAMTGLEFLQAQEDNSYRDVAVMKSLVIQFVSQGYRNVPDSAHLSAYKLVSRAPAHEQPAFVRRSRQSAGEQCGRPPSRWPLLVTQNTGVSLLKEALRSQDQQPCRPQRRMDRVVGILPESIHR